MGDGAGDGAVLFDGVLFSEKARSVSAEWRKNELLKSKHKIPGRIRVHMGQSRMSFDQADTLQYFLETQPGVTKATVYEQTQDAVIRV